MPESDVFKIEEAEEEPKRYFVPRAFLVQNVTTKHQKGETLNDTTGIKLFAVSKEKAFPGSFMNVSLLFFSFEKKRGQMFRGF